MRGKLQDALNSAYARMIRRFAKWALLIMFTMLMAVGGSVKFVMPEAKKRVLDNKGVVVERDSSGKSYTLYEDEKVPDSYEEELNTGAPQLIYENQTRSREDDSHQTGRGEDAPLDRVRVTRADRRVLQQVTAGFLSRWESFEVGDTYAQYRGKLLRYLDPSHEDEVLSRADNIQDAAVARNGISGSFLEPYSDPGGEMRVLRFDGRSAYVAAAAEIRYTGPAIAWTGRHVRRSYALVLTRYRDGWKISRAAAQTQGEIIE